VMQADGSYVRDASDESCQQVLIDLAERSRKQRQRKRRGFARRNLKS
jgi:hypothetical protein